MWRVRVVWKDEGDVWKGEGDMWKGEGDVWGVRVMCGG